MKPSSPYGRSGVTSGALLIADVHYDGKIDNRHVRVAQSVQTGVTDYLMPMLEEHPTVHQIVYGSKDK